MGKRLERRTYVLHFAAGTYLDGAEIRIRSTPISVLDELEALNFTDSIPLLLAYLEDWNLEDADGEPLKRTEEALKEHFEMPVLKEIIVAWLKAGLGITAPLDPPSDSGPPSPDTASMERSMPMEPLSPNPPS